MCFPIANLLAGLDLAVLASAAVGGSAGLIGWWWLRILSSEDTAQGGPWRYDVSRINELRRLDPVYRYFQPAIALLARFNRIVFRDALLELQREILAAGLPRYWLAEEYLARSELLALATTPVYVYLFVQWLGATGILVAVLAVLATGWLLRRQVAVRARARLQRIKRRMPFLLDLLTLLMEAGATFLYALRQAVEEFRGDPVSEEFGRVLIDMNLGKTRAEAFQAMRDRLADDEITSILSSILQGENLGTPLGQIFRTQADVLRLKRSQRAETLAGEAGVNMLLPAVLIMVATVLVIVGPFLLNFVRFGLSL